MSIEELAANLGDREALLSSMQEETTLSVPVSDLLDSEMREPALPAGWASQSEASDVSVRFSTLRQGASRLNAGRGQGKREDNQAAKLDLMVQVAEFAEWVAKQKPINDWERDSPARRQLLVEIQEAAKADGVKPIRVQKNSTDISLIARGLFGKNRHTGHVFSVLIERAGKEGVGAEGLADWVTERGGIHAAFTRHDALERMWNTPPIATIHLERSIVGEQGGEMPKVILATIRATGEVDIRCVVENDAAASRALSAWIA